MRRSFGDRECTYATLREPDAGQFAGNPSTIRAKILERLQKLLDERYVSPFDLALVYCGFGETDQAFTWLDEAQRGRAYGIVLIGVDPGLDPLRTDPRFSDLLQRIHLVGERNRSALRS